MKNQYSKYNKHNKIKTTFQKYFRYQDLEQTKLSVKCVH